MARSTCQESETWTTSPAEHGTVVGVEKAAIAGAVDTGVGSDVRRCVAVGEGLGAGVLIVRTPDADGPGEPVSGAVASGEAVGASVGRKVASLGGRAGEHAATTSATRASGRPASRPTLLSERRSGLRHAVRDSPARNRDPSAVMGNPLWPCCRMVGRIRSAQHTEAGS